MERLSGMDASFLIHGDARYACPGHGHHRRRVLEVPFNLGHPVWIEDPNFDLDRHVHRIGVPKPGGMHELAEVVGHFASTPLDRTRPLWEMWVIEGLEDGHVAIVTKMHHSAIDGVTGADLLVNLFDLTPEVASTPPPEDWEPERRPSNIELVADAVVGMVYRPLRMARTMVKLGHGIVNAVNNRRHPDASPAALPFTAPHTPFNAPSRPTVRSPSDGHHWRT